MDRQIVCITPVKNESWILEKFLRCASLWADVIIVADQNSHDGSAEIATGFSKVRLVKNEAEDFNEPERQQLLLREARKLPGEKTIVALDADEILTGNFLASDEWNRLLRTEPVGTVFNFRWVNLYPDFSKCWVPEKYFPWAVVDDGKTELDGRAIHSVRVPIPPGGKQVYMEDIKVLHYQYTDWERMRSKQRWYQVWEWQNNNEKSMVRLHRKYRHMHAVNEADIRSVDEAWFANYLQSGINVKEVHKQGRYYWDAEILDIMAKAGAKSMARVPIWDVDWTQKAKQYNMGNTGLFRDPRSFVLRKYHNWLTRSQPTSTTKWAKIRDFALSKIGL